MVSGNYPTFFLVLHWQYRGDTEGTVVPEERVWKVVYLFVLLSSEKNEPRSAAAVIHVLFLLTPPSFGHLSYILWAKHPVILRDTAGRRVIVTLCLNSPRPFSSVSLATSPPDKGGIGVCAFACILIPSPFPPYCYCNFPQCYETRQGRDWGVFHFFLCFDFKCDTPQCYSCGNIRGEFDTALSF